MSSLTYVYIFSTWTLIISRDDWGQSAVLLSPRMPFTLFKFPTLFGRKQNSYKLDRSVSGIIMIEIWLKYCIVECPTDTARPGGPGPRHPLQLQTLLHNLRLQQVWGGRQSPQSQHSHIQLLLLPWPSSILRQYQANPGRFKIQTCHASFSSIISISH